jgi:PAS domain S-box-containing protein
MVTSVTGRDKAEPAGAPAATATGFGLGDEHVFTTLFDESPTGMMIVGPRKRLLPGRRTPAALGPIRVNRAACEMLGYSEVELCAMSMDDLTEPADREANAARFADLHVGAVSTLRLEKKYVRKDGTALWVDLTTNAIAGSGGMHFLNVMVDITERKRAEAALHASEQAMRSLIEGLPGFVYRCDIDAVMSTTYVSPQVKDICGITAELYLADPDSWVNLIHPDDRETVVSAYAKAIEKGRVFEMEYRLIHPDGTTRWVRDHAVAVRDLEGRALYCQGVVLDVTQSKDAAAARAESEAKSKFLAGMSHELRTPLNAVLGFAQLLGGGELTEKQARYVKHIRTSGEQLLGLVEQLLDLTKVQAGEMDVQLESVEVRECVSVAIDRVTPLAAAANVDLAAVECSSGVAASADRRRLGQVLLNLLSNAIKFTPAGGRVRVSCASAGGRVLIAVQDTGVGIAPGDQEAIFDEFKQVGSRTKEIQGTGLGLALSRALMDAMNGSISVESAPGRGSTFTVRLPLAVSLDR